MKFYFKILASAIDDQDFYELIPDYRKKTITNSIIYWLISTDNKVGNEYIELDAVLIEIRL